MKYHEPHMTPRPHRMRVPTPGRRGWTVRLGILAVATLLSACGSAYVDSRREAGKRINIGPSNADVVAICTGDGIASPKVLKLAAEKCAETGRVPRYESRTRLACNVTAPTRVFYRCVKPGGAIPTATKADDTKAGDAKAAPPNPSPGK